MKIVFKKSFDKSKSKLDLFVRRKLTERLLIFESNPFHELLLNHALRGEYEGYRSINITGDYRAIFAELSLWHYEFVEFVEIGTHSQLYGE